MEGSQQQQPPTPPATTAQPPQTQQQDTPLVDRAKQESAQHPESTDALLRQILAEQQSHREEVAQLREQIDAQKPQQFTQAATNLSPEEMTAARMEEIGQHDFYCPGCGLLYDYQQRCTGRAESPHAPIEVISTDELKTGDTSKHTKPEYVKL